MTKESPNLHFQGLTVNRQIARSLSYANPTKVYFQDGTVGGLQGDYIVQDLKIDGENFQKLTLVEECLSQIVQLEINDIIVAKHSKTTGVLETTGLGWKLYHTFLPEHYRITKA